jgi:hypothetical protein
VISIFRLECITDIKDNNVVLYFVEQLRCVSSTFVLSITEANDLSSDVEYNVLMTYIGYSFY